jgi:ABC-type phosphate/phosphonate transport system substrate-binding protein
VVRAFWAAIAGAMVGVIGLPRGGAAENPAPDTNLRIGMLEGMFRDVQPALVNAMSRPFRAMFERQTGFTGDVEILTDAEALAGRMKAKNLDLGVFHGFEYAQVRARHPDLRPLVVTMPNSRLCQACVVVNASSKAASLADLKGEALVIPRGAKAHSLAYVEKARRGLPATTAKPAPKPNETNEEVLNAIAANTCAAALVDVGAFTAYQAFQPGLSKALRVLCKSETFPVSVIAYRKGAIDEDGVGKIRQGLIQANKTAQGKPLMLLWNLKGFEEVPADYDAQLETILKAYPAPASGK